MTSKLTLSMEKELIEFAHSYTRKNGLSISGLVEQFLKDLRDSGSGSGFDSKTLSLYGLLEDTPLPDRKEVRKLFHEKGSH